MKEDNDCPYEKFIVVDVFDSPANYQGIQSGWFAKIVKDKFNMELNIIAPNVAGGGDKLYEIRSAAGDLGDLIILDASNGKLHEAVTAGILLDMSKYLEGKDIMQYEIAIKALNEEYNDGESIYAIPSSVSANTPLMPSEALELSYGTYLRWDLYAELGYPKMETLEDLLPVLKKMQEMAPVSESGKPTYAFSFFKDWDGNLMNAAKQPACLYGYDESGFVLARADGTDYQSIIDEDSLYIRSLKLFFDANQMGLVDPESPIQNYDAVFQKYVDGQILFSVWPWLGQSAYNTLSNKEEGKGFMLAPVEDIQIYSYGCIPEGNQKSVIGIGSNAEDPQRLADFIDWLYSPEGIMMNGAQMSGGTAGPEGLTWELTKDGPVLTEFGVQALMNGEATVPKEWGGGIWSEGGSALNFKPVAQCEISPDGYAYSFELWDSVRDMEATALDVAWREYMQADSTMDYLERHNMIVVAPGHPGSIKTESSDISTMRNQCKTIIVDYSWQMIFAENEEAFYSLLKEMQTKASSLGYNTVYHLDLTNAKMQDRERQKAVEKYNR
ncbi:MAG: extracellular solute-binding protein [Lachnospiraceae bacterium]|nr:extracellular solute-binding protein [Lachnospiraceae bacterium]